MYLIVSILEYWFLRKNRLNLNELINDQISLKIKYFVKQEVMKQKNEMLKAKEILPMSKETKQRLAELAKKIEGKELFQNKIERAKKSLKNIKTLPI